LAAPLGSRCPRTGSSPGGCSSFDAGDALEAVREAIEADDWTRAQRRVDAAAMRFAQHDWAATIIATMRRLIGERDKRLASKEAAFARRTMSTRLSQRDEPNVRRGRFAVGAGVPAPQVRTGEGKSRDVSGGGRRVDLATAAERSGIGLILA